jgi:hypothetical protein
MDFVIYLFQFQVVCLLFKGRLPPDIFKTVIFIILPQNVNIFVFFFVQKIFGAILYSTSLFVQDQ